MKAVGYGRTIASIFVNLVPGILLSSTLTQQLGAFGPAGFSAAAYSGVIAANNYAAECRPWVFKFSDNPDGYRKGY